MTRRRGCLGVLIVLVALCALAGLVSALSNRSLPVAAPDAEQLSALDKARLAEALHLRETLGNQIWPGFGDADIPVLLWNREASFLIGVDEAPAGWQQVPGAAFMEKPYFRQATDDPQNFAVPVDGRLAASIATKSETDAFLVRQFQSMLPPPLKQVFPYRLLIQPSEVQISAVLHEGFHVLQSQVAAQKLAAAEAINARQDDYWRADAAAEGAWKDEVALLDGALRAESPDDTRNLVRQFIDQRQARRAAQDLPAELVRFEQLIEWEEGLAKYVELASWQQAAETDGYAPLAELSADPDFKGYDTFGQRWSQELSTMKRQAGQEGVTRFYYTGAAQAFLLDRLSPGWQVHAMEPDVFLEDLLAEAIVPGAGQ
ncbi:MAG: hypothetical protein R2844_23830 [Caldilineales bacterium]